MSPPPLLATAATIVVRTLLERFSRSAAGSSFVEKSLEITTVVPVGREIQIRSGVYNVESYVYYQYHAHQSDKLVYR